MCNMYKIKETIIVEGIYDKIKLSSFINGTIICTNGFTVFKNNDLINMLKTIAEKDGIVILTDSDSAGFKIRNYIKNCITTGVVKHAYIPDIKGKEKRKTIGGKEGLLGVEGINKEDIIKSLIDSGCVLNDIENKAVQAERKITKSDLFVDGLSGGKNSTYYRKVLANELSIPEKISTNMLVDYLNRMFKYDEYINLINELKYKL